MDRIPPTLSLSLAVALDFFTTSANTKRYAPLNRDGDFLYVQLGQTGEPEPLVFTSWDEAVQAAKDHDVPYISVGGNGRVVERITTPYGGTDFGRVIPVPPAGYDEFAGRLVDKRAASDSPTQEAERAGEAAKKRRSRASKRQPKELLPT